MSAKLLSKYQRQIDSVQGRLTKFQDAFAKDPAHALIWGTDAFKAAAQLQVLKQIVSALQDGNATADNIRSTMLDRVLNKSKYPPQSTSPTSNLIEQYELAACSEILSDLQYFTE